MSGKSPYATPEERHAAKLEADRRRHLRIKADPVKHAQRSAAKLAAERQRRERIRADPVLLEQFRMRKREAWARAAERKQQMKPQPVISDLHRQHGPFSALFALQAAA